MEKHWEAQQAEGIRFKGQRSGTMSRSRSTWAVIILLTLIMLLYVRLWPHCHTVVYHSTSGGSTGKVQSSVTSSYSTFPLRVYSDNDSLVGLLGNLTFKNYGVVRSSDQYVWKQLPCLYLESQNVSGPYVGWAVTGHYNYLYHNVTTDFIPPPSGMRSSVPLGGISTGNIELRADGSFHEWSIFNQHPAGAAKTQLIDEVFMGVRAAVQDRKPVSLVLQTHPKDPRLLAVERLEYHGAYPTSKLDVHDTRLPLEVSVYAYSWYKHNDMNRSATPAVAFTAVMKNPLKESATASFMFNLPLGVEPHTQRFAQQMSINPPISEDERPTAGQPAYTPLECFTSCSLETSCRSWSFDVEAEICYMFNDVRLNGHDDNSYAGVKGSWSVSSDCITLNRAVESSSANGNISLCPFSSDDQVSFSFGAGQDVYSLWQEYEEKGQFTTPEAGYYVTGATAASVTLAPGETKEVTIVLGWYFPDRDFLGLPVGNFYSHLFEDSVDAANQLGHSLTSAVADIANLHSTFFQSSMPTSLQDMLINSLSHVRSAFWLRDGRWRQWEAYDCVNIDSVHNDGERHIPYISIFPNSTINKMYAWAKFQLENGMIQEQLRCGCTTLPLSPQVVEFGCGRVMSDVSSMFIVYLLELLTWHDDSYTRQVVEALWPNAKKAAEWHIQASAAEGIPGGLVDTYDVLGLNAYPYDAYSGAFHLLAMRAAETLAYWIGDTDFAMECHSAYLRGQQALDRLLWNETAGYYNAYHPYNKLGEFKAQTQLESVAPSLTRLELDDKEVRALPDPPGAIMTDTFYAQVLAYSLGLGTLVQNETRLRLHMKAELDHNDTPYGMLVLTGRYPYPGPGTDNAVWMMGNPNWATITIHLGEEVNEALEVGLKVMEHWRSVVHDQWNVVGIAGGLGYGIDGLPYFTSHYGYFMSSWHMVMALSGQKANVTEHSLTFDPKLEPPFTLPVLLPGVWGYLQANQVQKDVGKDVYYSIALHFGSLSLVHLAVGDCVYPSTSILVTGLTTWNCTYTKN